MLFSLILLTNVSIAFDINVDHYQRDEVWKKPPTVVVCNNAPVSLKQVKAAVKIWQSKGEVFGVIRKQHAGECNNKWTHAETGDIIITKDVRFLDDKYTYNGMTVRYTYEEDRSNIVSAICEISDIKVKREPGYAHKLLVHEIGHAIGYSHAYHTKNDVMQESLEGIN